MKDETEGGRSLPPGYFEHVYTANADPWGFESSPYEAAKYDATVQALPRSHYRKLFEIGCSFGVLTERLAPRCGDLLAVDVVESVLERARERCRRFAHVRIDRMSVPNEFPAERFGAIVVSEVGYYWSPRDLERARWSIAERLEPGGHLVLVHWTPVVPDYPLSGDEVHDAFVGEAGRRLGLAPIDHRREATFRLDVIERR